jgi:hypothetical protein
MREALGSILNTAKKKKKKKKKVKKRFRGVGGPQVEVETFNTIYKDLHM